MVFTVFQNIVSVTGYVLEAFGVVIIIVGAVRATARALPRISGEPNAELARSFRLEIGRAMLAGLEFLVAGDIIRTVIVEHTVGDVLGLGLIVLIRTVLVFTIHLEVEGRWPWQHSGREASSS